MKPIWLWTGAYWSHRWSRDQHFKQNALFQRRVWNGRRTPIWKPQEPTKPTQRVIRRDSGHNLYFTCFSKKTLLGKSQEMSKVLLLLVSSAQFIWLDERHSESMDIHKLFSTSLLLELFSLVEQIQTKYLAIHSQEHFRFSNRGVTVRVLNRNGSRGKFQMEVIIPNPLVWGLWSEQGTCVSLCSRLECTWWRERNFLIIFSWDVPVTTQHGVHQQIRWRT